MEHVLGIERERGISCVWVASRGGGDRSPEKRTPETVEGLAEQESDSDKYQEKIQ